MFVVTENMLNNVPFFNFMEKHNSVNRSVSIGLKPDDGVCLIRKYQVFEICIYFPFFRETKRKFLRNFFMYVHLNSNYVTPTLIVKVK